MTHRGCPVCDGIFLTGGQLPACVDQTYPEIDMTTFSTRDEWKEFYRDADEAIPLTPTKPTGKEVDLHMMVDSDHTGDSTQDLGFDSPGSTPCQKNFDCHE